MLCNVCKSIFGDRATSGKHHASIEELWLAATSDCQICASVWKEYRQTPGCVDFRGPGNTLSFRWEFCWNKSQSQSIWPSGALGSWRDGYFHLDKPGFHILNIVTATPRKNPFGIGDDMQSERDAYRHTLWLFPSQENYKHTFQNCSRLQEFGAYMPSDLCQPSSSHTGDDQAVGIAKAWIASCDTDHPDCVFDRNPRPGRLRWWPKRLLDVTDAIPKLINTGRTVPQDVSDSRYAALSHC